MFIEMINGYNAIITVPAGAVNQYKNLGFRVVNELNKSVITTTLPVGENKIQDNDIEIKNLSVQPEGIVDDLDGILDDNIPDDWDEGTSPEESQSTIGMLKEKPLSEWTKEEMQMYINEYGIDISSVKKTGQIREIIRKHLNA